MKRLLLLVMIAALLAPATGALAGEYATAEALENYGELDKPKYGTLRYLGNQNSAPSHWRAQVEIPRINGQPPDRGQVLAAANEVFQAMEREAGPVRACVIQFFLKGHKSSSVFALLDIEGGLLKFEWGPEWRTFSGPPDGPKPVYQE